MSTFPAAINALRPHHHVRPHRHSRRSKKNGGILPDHDRRPGRRKRTVGTLDRPSVPYGEVADVVEDIVEAYLALRCARPDEMHSSTRSSGLASNPFRERVYATRLKAEKSRATRSFTSRTTRRFRAMARL